VGENSRRELNKMKKQNPASGVSALMIVFSIAATFGGWLVLSVVRPVRVAQVTAPSFVRPIPIVMREPSTQTLQPIVFTYTS
jgi:hypothetical protein